MSAPASKVDVLSPAVARYLDELAAEIAQRGDLRGDLFAEAVLAHERRRKFASEILVCETRRSKIAKRVIALRVFAAANVHAELAAIADEEPRHV